MIIELSPEECQNVRVAIRALIKSPQLDENAMKQLLVLSDKFVVKEEKKEEKKV